MSEAAYLDTPCRALESVAADLDARIAALTDERRRVSVKRALLVLVNEAACQEFDELGERMDALSDEIGPLKRRLEIAEEEIEIRQRRRDGSHAPIVL